MSPERVLQGTQLQVKAGLGLGTVLKGVTKGNLARPIDAGRAMMKTVANANGLAIIIGCTTSLFGAGNSFPSDSPIDFVDDLGVSVRSRLESV